MYVRLPASAVGTYFMYVRLPASAVGTYFMYVRLPTSAVGTYFMYVRLPTSAVWIYECLSTGRQPVSRANTLFTFHSSFFILHFP